MATTAKTTDSLAISRVLYMVDGNALNQPGQDFDVPANDIPPFIPVNAPGPEGDGGICYGGTPSGGQTVTRSGAGYPTDNRALQTRPVNNQPGGTDFTGRNLTISATAQLNGSNGTATINASTVGTGYVTGDQVEVLGNTPGAQTAILTIVGAGTENELVTENKEQQRAQCERMMPFNATEGISYGEVVNGSNVVGIADLTIAVQSPAADGTVTEAGANQGRQFWNDQQTLTLEATIVATPEGTGADANRTVTWLANGAGLEDNAGTEVADQPLRRDFAIGDIAADDNLVVTCTVLYTDAAGASATESFLIEAQ